MATGRLETSKCNFDRSFQERFNWVRAEPFLSRNRRSRWSAAEWIEEEILPAWEQLGSFTWEIRKDPLQGIASPCDSPGDWNGEPEARPAIHERKTTPQLQRRQKYNSRYSFLQLPFIKGRTRRG